MSILFSWWKTSELPSSHRIKSNTLAWYAYKVAPSPVSSPTDPMLSQRELRVAVQGNHPLSWPCISKCCSLCMDCLFSSWQPAIIFLSPGDLMVYLREKSFLSTHSLHCAWQMVVRRFSMHVILMAEWMNKWMDRWMSPWMSEWTNEWMNQ